jgi:hypothetical protein
MGKQSRIKLERWLERRLAEWQAPSSYREHTPKSLFSDRAISLIGLFLSLLSVGGQSLFPTLYAVWVACFSIGIGGLVFALSNEGVFGQSLSSRKPLCLTISGLIMVGAAILGWDRARQLAEPPDVDLVFVYPEHVSPLMINPTDKVIQQPKYQVVIWNLDHPERTNPLPIPARTGDFIRPHNAWGPNQMLGIPGVRPLVAIGEHLFGFAQALCPDCKRNHYYWVYIEHGKHGWYCELPPGQIVDLNFISEQIRTNAGDSWINELASPGCRKPVEPYS